MIVKVQRPLASSSGNMRECLVYAQHRRLMTQQDVPDAVWLVLTGRQGGKAYFEAEWNEATRNWTIGAQVEDRAW